MGGAGWLVMGLFWVAVIALVIWLAVRMLPSGTRNASPPPPAGESPPEILERRFARGEIDLETYQVQRAALVQARGGKP